MMFSASMSSGVGPLEADVAGPNAESDIAYLTIRAKDRQSEISIFRRGPLALEQILDLGYEIVNAARKLMPTSTEDLMAAPEMQAEAEAHVPFAINDAIDRDEAMEAGIDSDLAERL